jgi:hypothetical protein
VSLAFQHLGIPQDMIEVLQTIRPLHEIPYPTWFTILEECAYDQLRPHQRGGGTLQEFLRQHTTGSYLAIIELPGEERPTHAVAVVDGISFNVSNTERQVFRVWKVQN